MGSPKVTRVLACSVESAMSFSRAPSAQAAMVRRPLSSTFIAILNPSPSRPSRFFRGTSQSSNTSSTVCEPRRPIFFSIVPTDTPGNLFSTANAEMPFDPFDLSVMAITVWTPAMSPLVMKCLTPLMTYLSPLSSAVVWRREASEPALGVIVGFGLCEVEGADEPAAGHLRQVFPLQLVVPADEDAHRADAVVGPDARPEAGVGEGELLVGDALRNHGQPLPTVFLRDGAVSYTHLRA